jgi:hypothetical protein
MPLGFFRLVNIFRSIPTLFTLPGNTASPVEADASSMRLKEFLADLKMLQLVRKMHTSRFGIKISDFRPSIHA